MSAYLWSDLDMDGLQFCATRGTGELVAVHDHGNYAVLVTDNKDDSNVEHYPTAEQARRAGEKYLQQKGISP
jgi:hypothetical protein